MKKATRNGSLYFIFLIEVTVYLFLRKQLNTELCNCIIINIVVTELYIINSDNSPAVFFCCFVNELSKVAIFFRRFMELKLRNIYVEMFRVKLRQTNLTNKYAFLVVYVTSICIIVFNSYVSQIFYIITFTNIFNKINNTNKKTKKNKQIRLNIK